MNNIYKKKLSIVALTIFSQVLSQLPIKFNHPTQIIMKRYSALGDIPLEYFGNNSISTIDANNYLNDYENNIIKIHKWDMQLALNDTNVITPNLKYKLNYLTKGLKTTNFNNIIIILFYIIVRLH